MSKQDRPNGLNRLDVQRVRLQLRTLDGKSDHLISRIGAAISHPRTAAGNPKRYRFGMALLALAIFEMLTVLALPDYGARWIFFGFAWLTMLVGAWQVDKAKKM